MIVALIAGGAGTRLWPLSTPDYPKHLLRVGGDKTLLQLAFDRAKRLTTKDKIYVVTEISHAHHVKKQLPELTDNSFIIEPARRNTSGCFLAVLHHINGHHDHGEPVAITWADHYIRDIDGWANSFKAAGEASKKFGLPALVGVEPTYPATALGYIHKGKLIEGEQVVYNFLGFKEKPDNAQAKKFFDSGEYLWNCGYMVGTLDSFVGAMQADCPMLWGEYQSLLSTNSKDSYQKAYLALENIAIDYVFNEMVKKMLVVAGTYDWMDVGSFRDLYGETEKDKDGNCLIGPKLAAEETHNSYIRNEEDKPVAVVGLDNVVVINTPAGILVVRQDLDQKVRDVAKQFI